MAKRGVLAVLGALIIAAIVASISFAFTEKEVFELQCNLTGKLKSDHYAFHVEIPKYLGSPRLVMVGLNTFDLKVVRLDNTKIFATSIRE